MDPVNTNPLTPDFKIEPLAEPLKLPRFSVPIKIAALLVGLVVLGVVLLFLFGASHYSDSNVTVTITSPHDAASGDQVIYTVSYTNKNRVALDHARLAFYYPSDSIPLKEGSVADITNETVDLGTVAAGATGTKDFTFLIVGAQGDIKTARTVLTYIPQGLPSEIPRSADGTTMIASLAVPLSIVAPPSVISGQAITYYVDYRNQSSKDMVALRLRVKYPEGFKPKTTLKELWDIPLLAVGDTKQIEVAGVLTGRERDVKAISVVLQKQISTPSGEVYVNFEKADASSIIASPPLSVELSLQDTTEYIAHVKDNLKYKITISNNGDADLSSITLSAKFEGAMYDVSTIQSDGFYDGRTRTITWTSAVIPQLGFLRAHESVTVPATVLLKSVFPGGADSFVKATIHAETSNVPASYQGDVLSGDTALITRVSTSPTFAQRVTVDDPQWGKIGPYPPQVDKETAYTVHWSLVNPSNDLVPAKITAVLMPGVVWKNQTRSTGTGVAPAYNAKLNTITWDVAAVPSGVGITLTGYDTFFQVSLTPSTNQVGSSAPLLKNMIFEGTDTRTGEKITRSTPDITTSSPEDAGRVGGSVQP